MRNTPRLIATACLLLVSSGGCMRYQIGVDSLYPQDIRTVHVRIFDSVSYRRYLGERLTEAVVKEIEARTPYKVVDSLAADAVLTGTLVAETKDILVENRFDETREALVNMAVQVNWAPRQGPAAVPTTVAVPVAPVEVNAGAALVPEVGQSMATAQQMAIQKLAARIVDLMEIDPLAGVDAPTAPVLLQ